MQVAINNNRHSLALEWAMQVNVKKSLGRIN
jgi:hypothetical protein